MISAALAQQIAELDDVQPTGALSRLPNDPRVLTAPRTEFDPEADFPDREAASDDGSDDGLGVSNAAREHYVDVGYVSYG